MIDASDLDSIELPHKNGPLNILLFGLSGVGKSSLINLIATAKRKLGVRSPADVRSVLNKENTLTVKYVSYKIAKNIQMWDTFGWTLRSTYTGSEFENMLLGKIGSGQHMDNLSVEHVPNQDNEIDLVLFVMDREAPTIQEEITEMKKFVDIAKNRGKPFSVVITKLDVNSDILDISDPNTFLQKLQSNKTFLEIKEMVWRKWGDAKIKVYPVVNYPQGATVRNPCLEKTGVALFEGIWSDIIQKDEDFEEEAEFDYFKDETVLLGRFVN